MNDSKISVIIPTVQKNINVLKHLVEILDSDNAVGEIIIINNAIEPFDPEFTEEKVKVIVPKVNLYVNPSWNYGVSIAENDIFLIINDDIVCPKNLCTVILNSNILNDSNTGLVGIDIKYLNNYNDKVIDEAFFDLDSITESSLNLSVQDRHLLLGDWGSAFFGRKSSYYEIPDIFKIIYGDNYLLYRNKLDGKINYKMTGLKFNHIHSLTCSSNEFSSVVAKDCIAGQEYFKQ